MRLLIIIFFLILSSCSLNKVQKHHGVHFLEKKNNQLIVKETNKNDVIEILGIPSTTSKFDNDVWIYIEREISRETSLNKKEAYWRNSRYQTYKKSYQERLDSSWRCCSPHKPSYRWRDSVCNEGRDVCGQSIIRYYRRSF